VPGATAATAYLVHLRWGEGEAAWQADSYSLVLITGAGAAEVVHLRRPLPSRGGVQLAVTGTPEAGWVVVLGPREWQAYRLEGTTCAEAPVTSGLRGEDRRWADALAAGTLYFAQGKLVSGVDSTRIVRSFDARSGKVGAGERVGSTPLALGKRAPDWRSARASALAEGKDPLAGAKTSAKTSVKAAAKTSGAAEAKRVGQDHLPPALPGTGGLPTDLAGGEAARATAQARGRQAATKAATGLGALPATPTRPTPEDLLAPPAQPGQRAGAVLEKGSAADYRPELALPDGVAEAQSTLTLAAPALGTTAERTREALRKPAALWYFGRGAGLDFNRIIDLQGDSAQVAATLEPATLTDGQLAQAEGVASVADTRGNLRLYTDGRTLYGPDHQSLEGGEGLWGHPSSQGLLIVPLPHAQNKAQEDYLVFVADQGGYAGHSSGLSVSRVNVTGNSGRVVAKNIPLQRHATEKLAAAHHADGKAIWVVGHEAGTNRFFAYLVTGKGVLETPVYSPVGTVHPSGGNGTIGQLAFAPDGRQLVSVVEGTGAIEVFAFNRATGELTEGRNLGAELPEAIAAPYGAAFSPSGRYLYLSAWRSAALYQLDLAADSVVVYRFDHAPTIEPFGNLQLAPDGRIYLAKRGSATLGRINRPDASRAAAGFALEAVPLGEGRSEFGLPGLVATWLAPPQAAFTPVGGCQDEPLVLVNRSSYAADAWDWTLVSAEGTEALTSAEVHPRVRLHTPGSYTLTLRARFGQVWDTTQTSIEITPKPTLDLGPDRTLPADGSGIELIATDALPVRWSTGATTPRIVVTEPGRYSVTTLGAGCVAQDAVSILPHTDPQASFPLAARGQGWQPDGALGLRSARTGLG
ncbi:MAG: beta-propeller fold lactonase family protein, partial [Bacteroidia bacterium]|nr:beta-propeller fold lactonase family protein [Bacteroidia bacterium]